MIPIRNISATLFDMDGTLVDSETLTEPAIVALCCELGVDDVGLDCSLFFGVAWREIERALLDKHPQMAGKADIATRLHEIYHQMMRDEAPPLIRMSRESVIAANQLMPTAIVSSSGRESIELTIRRMDIGDNIDYYAGAEDYAASKPAPDGYLKAAEMLQIEARECLVFEDSIPGMQSAKNAGMQVVAMTHRCNDIPAASEIADLLVTDYAELDDGFFDLVRKKD
jgi:HAD superfamily hydrolase (TIGR01509 family)